MRWLKSITREILGLFVDDGSFAIAILIWLVIVIFVLPHATGTTSLGLILFSGLALILVESVLRFARSRK